MASPTAGKERARRDDDQLTVAIREASGARVTVAVARGARVGDLLHAFLEATSGGGLARDTTDEGDGSGGVLRWDGVELDDAALAVDDVKLRDDDLLDYAPRRQATATASAADPTPLAHLREDDGDGVAPIGFASLAEEEAALVARLGRRVPSRREIESTEAHNAEPTPPAAAAGTRGSVTVETTTPCFWDYYPRTRRIFERLRDEEKAGTARDGTAAPRGDGDGNGVDMPPPPPSAALALLRACDWLLRTGDATRMSALVDCDANEGDGVGGSDGRCAAAPISLCRGGGGDDGGGGRDGGGNARGDGEGSTSRLPPPPPPSPPRHWQTNGGDHGWFDFDDAANSIAEAARRAGAAEASFAARGFRYRLDLTRMLQFNLATGTARPVRCEQA